MNPITVPCLADNYCYLLPSGVGNSAFLFDASESGPIIGELQKNNLVLDAIFLTHGHGDHVSGLKAIRKAFPEAKVFGHPNLSSKFNSLEAVSDGQEIKLGGVIVKSLHTVCHSDSDVCFLIKLKNDQILFSGDTVFSGGCGRFFHGTPKDMCAAFDKISGLKETTEIYFGHEYTMSNLLFAQSIEPENRKIRCEIERLNNLKISTPTSLGKELEINPFFRLSEKVIADNLDLISGSELAKHSDRMRVMRELKNSFKS